MGTKGIHGTAMWEVQKKLCNLPLKWKVPL